ncbi:MAG: protoporphyrinogen oxidase HemJ [Alphaproteobacteria bacterium]|nr:protoporphyrinogen oxidase HemJ [Alphaproteobacteria bacterium]
MSLSRWLSEAYPWVKSLHIVSMVAWMAGLFYLPRLFVYHSMAPAGSGRSETFKLMERRLQKGIMTPAMIATWCFGLLLAGTPGLVDWRTGWIWAKLLLVAGLTAFHFLLARWRKAFCEDRNRRSTGFFRAVNELPTVALIAIVLLVVVKPF